MGQCSSSPQKVSLHDVDVWASKMISLHRQIENPQYFILLKKRYVMQDIRFKEVMENQYHMCLRAFRKRVPRDIFEDVQEYDIRVQNQYVGLLSN